MSLDLATLFPQLRDLGQLLFRQYEDAARTLPALLQALPRCAQQDPAVLERKIERAGPGWYAALPTQEPVHQTYTGPPAPETYTVAGSDGSQVEPDRHAAALYYLINIGSIRIRVGSGHAPEAHSTPQLYFEEEELYGEGYSLIHSDLIRAKRDVSELAELVRLSQEPGQPFLALVDNGLRLWLTVQDRSRDRDQAKQITQAYDTHLIELEKAGAALAGYIDRPRHADVVRLLYLADLDLEDIDEIHLQKNPYRRFSDRALFQAHLKPGERSALFISPSRENGKPDSAGQQIQFFYLHTAHHDQIARVEIPLWVAQSPALLDLVHGGLLEQCGATGLPYALIRAHELAVVAGGERRTLEQALDQIMLDAGIPPRISQKSLTKRWTSQS